MWRDIVYWAVAVSGGVVIAALSATTLALDIARWRKLAVATALTVGVVNLALGLHLHFDAESNALLRDVAALVLLAAACPIAVAAAARIVGTRIRHRLVRVIAAVAVVVVFAAAVPFVLLFVHCTSGDCL
jgi:hypothetical protein